MMNLVERIASAIDLALLQPSLTPQDIECGCADAERWKMASVCVLPCWVKLATQFLERTPIAVGTVVGFPLGGNLTDVKVLETQRAIEDGATEIDMVINVGMLKAGNLSEVQRDIESVIHVARTTAMRLGRPRPLIKVILEMGYLTNDEKIHACKIAQTANADFVKTSTGFGPSGASIEDVRLMREVVGDAMKIKAAGGIRTLEQALAFLDAGADRLGTSKGVAILEAAYEQMDTS